MKFPLLLLGLLFATVTLSATTASQDFTQARANAALANEGYARSLRLTKAWMEARDPASGLIPSRLKGGRDRTDVWEPHNAGADNYAFMVLAAYLLDRPLYDGEMAAMLRAERKLTSRIQSLPDVYSFPKRDFLHATPDDTRITFGTAEYIKDGLIPLAEYIGPSPWTDRMVEMIDDLDAIQSVAKGESMENYKAVDEEINGDLLQALSRLYWMTGNPSYLERAKRIGDFYLLGERDLSQVEYLRLRDHGCEIIGGLSELYVTLHYADRSHKERYRSNFYRLLDRILKVGRNEDGLFYDGVNMRTGSVVEDRIADTWGYILNAYYSVHLVDGHAPYRDAATQAMAQLNRKYRNHAWEGESHDGYADSIESALNLIHRVASPETDQWIDSEIQVMWAMQQDNGVVAGWWGDGNFTRTSIMYSLWKTQGVHCHPWREDLVFGAEKEGAGLKVVLTAGSDWQGRLSFDRSRHRENLNLPIDYPRINQFPEWFTVERDRTYSISSSDPRIDRHASGAELIDGVPLRLRAGTEIRLTIESR